MEMNSFKINQSYYSLLPSNMNIASNEQLKDDRATPDINNWQSVKQLGDKCINEEKAMVASSSDMPRDEFPINTTNVDHNITATQLTRKEN